MSIHLISDKSFLTKRGVNADMSRKNIFDFPVDNRVELGYYLVDVRTACVFISIVPCGKGRIVMATLSSGPRVNARSTPRIHEGIKRNCIELSERGLVFEGRQVSAEALVSALLKCYLDLTLDEQLTMMRPALKELEKELEEMDHDFS